MWEVLGYLTRLPAQGSVAASLLSQPRGVSFIFLQRCDLGLMVLAGAPPALLARLGNGHPDDLPLLPTRVIPWGDAASPSPVQKGYSHTQARPIQATLGPDPESDFPGYLAWS